MPVHLHHPTFHHLFLHIQRYHHNNNGPYQRKPRLRGLTAERGHALPVLCKAAIKLQRTLHTSNIVQSLQVDKDKPNAVKRILSTSGNAAILRAFKGKHQLGGPDKRAKFDEEIAALITSGANLIKVSCNEGREIPEGADFWGQAKKHTLLGGVKDITVYHFALKLLEARKHALDKEAEGAIEMGLPESNKDETLTAKALDGFTAAVDVASVMYPIQAMDLNAFMDGDLAQDLVLDDDADDEGEYDDVDELADNLSAQPMEQHSTAGVNLPKPGGLSDVSTMTNAQASGEGDEGISLAEAIAGIDTAGIMEYMDDDATFYDDDIDEEMDLSEDEFGMKGNQVLENIEETDAWRMYCRDNKFVPMEDFVKTPVAKQIMADRAPHLASLLNATVMADDNYEHDLEKHLLRRADLNPEQMQQREANRAKTWEEFDARRRGKQTERNLAQQAALLSVSAYDGQADEYDEFDEEDEDGDIEMAD